MIQILQISVNVNVLGLIMFNQWKLWKVLSIGHSDEQTYPEEPKETLVIN